MEFFLDATPALNRWESLQSVLSATPDDFEMPSLKEFEKLGVEERQALDAARMDYISGGITIRTPHLQELIDATVAVMSLNRTAVVGRRSVLVSGPSTVGKTTSCLALMRYVYTRFADRHPDLIEAGAVPVCYIEAPPGSTPKSIMQRLADFYSLPYRERSSLNELKRMVVEAMRNCTTQVVVVDELHNLARKSSSNGESVDTLKDLSNDAPATFVYAGIELEAGGLLAGPRGDQIARRSTPIRMGTFDYVTEDEVHTWDSIVYGFSQSLPLFEDNPEALVNHAQWLHQRSGGNIGTLQSILVQSVQHVIRAGNPRAERLTKDVMSEALLDIRAINAGQLAHEVAEAGTSRKGRSRNVA